METPEQIGPDIIPGLFGYKSSSFEFVPTLHPPCILISPMTSASDELAYLKSLVNQLSDKIKELEAKTAPKKPPAQQLRTILVGPPGAGACTYIYVACASTCAQRARARICC